MPNQRLIIGVNSTTYTKAHTKESALPPPIHLATGLERGVAVERWAPVPGSDRHEVSTLGRIRSWRTPKGRTRLTSPFDVKPRAIADGYLGFAKQTYLHVAVLEAFVGPCPEGHEAAHGDGNKHNNALNNLRWATHAENIADKQRHRVKYVRRPHDLDAAERIEIYRRRAAGEGRAQLSYEFGVTQQTISRNTHIATRLVAQ